MIEKEILRKAQLKMVDILVEIDKICVNHDIKYWLAYGTLLGAVRHKGFIPWDDDCDICMMRDDYEKFMKVAPQELPEKLFLQSKEIDPNYPKNITKVRMKNTKLVEFDESENEKYHQGIFVDIFIWDYHHPAIKKVMESISFVGDWKYARKKYPKGSLKRSLIQVSVAIPYILYSAINKCLYVMAKTVRKNKELHCIGQDIEGCDMKFYEPKDIFPIKKDILFEGKYFSVPNDCDVVLSKKYGDYMTLPPLDKRLWHAKKIELGD